MYGTLAMQVSVERQKAGELAYGSPLGAPSCAKFILTGRQHHAESGRSPQHTKHLAPRPLLPANHVKGGGQHQSEPIATR